MTGWRFDLGVGLAVRRRSAQSAKPETRYGGEGAGVPCGERHPALERGRRSERIGQADSGLASDTACSFRDRSVDLQLSKGGEQSGSKIRGGASSEELRSGVRE